MSFEKRSFPRINVESATRYLRFRARSTEHKTAVVRNYSSGGILFRTGEAVPVNSMVMLEFSPPQAPAPLRVISRITRSRKLSERGSHLVGGTFIDLTEEERSALTEFFLVSKEPDWITV